MISETQALNNYISILEKTNQQLNFWYNPYGLIVGILTLMVALIAMAVAYALWRHSKEQRDRVKQVFAEQEKIIKERNEQAQRIEDKINELINEYRKQLKSTTKQGKKELQRTIEELKKEKARLGVYIGPLSVSGLTSTMRSSAFPQRAGFADFYGSSIYGLNREKSMICTQCGKIFSYYSDQSDQNSILYQTTPSLENKYVYCPSCGAKNIPQ